MIVSVPPLKKSVIMMIVIMMIKTSVGQEMPSICAGKRRAENIQQAQLHSVGQTSGSLPLRASLFSSVKWVSSSYPPHERRLLA